MEENKKELTPEVLEFISAPGKSGIKTTELWVTFIGVIVPAVLSVLQQDATARVVLGVAALILPAIYVWGRCILKAEQVKTTNLLTDDVLEQMIANGLIITEETGQAFQQEMEKHTTPSGEVEKLDGSDG